MIETTLRSHSIRNSAPPTHSMQRSDTVASLSVNRKALIEAPSAGSLCHDELRTIIDMILRSGAVQQRRRRRPDMREPHGLD